MSDRPQQSDKHQSALEKERFGLLRRVEKMLETPMVVLAFAWLVLLIIDLTRGLTPALELAGTAIWVIFIIEFLIKFTLAPRKLAYLKHNWLTAISLVVPALRVFRIASAFRVLRLTRAARGIRLVKVVGSLNRGIRSVSRTMKRRGLKYVLLLTAIVVFGGAAGLQAFEPDQITSYIEALWWTMMIMTSQSTEYSPQTGEGRILFLMLSIYAIAVLGYATATLASLFISHDQDEDETQRLARVEARLNDIYKQLSPPSSGGDRENDRA